MIAVNETQLGLATQQILDLPGSRAGKKKEGFVVFFPVADKVILKYLTSGPQSASEIIDEKIRTGTVSRFRMHGN
jgi:hypothetical protein